MVSHPTSSAAVGCVPAMPRPWLPAHRKLLGKLRDPEIARRAKVHKSTVSHARRKLGIPSSFSRRRNLGDVSRKEVLAMVRARARAGKSMRGWPEDDWSLINLCHYHFGGWYQAVDAAGLKPMGTPSSAATRPPPRRPLTNDLLRGKKSIASLERLTGVRNATIRRRRALIGVVRDERRRVDPWLEPVRHLLGKLSDPEVARRAGVSPTSVKTVRNRLGIAPMPQRSHATKSGVRERLAALPAGKLRKLLAGLDQMDEAIVRARYILAPPMTLAEIGRWLGISKQAVRKREMRAITKTTALMRVPRA